MPAPRHVALLIESSREFGRGLLRGIAQFVHEHPHWLTTFRPHGLGESPFSWISHWQGDGIVARIENERIAEVLLRRHVPLVDVRGNLRGRLNVPAVLVHDRAISEMAAKHLLDRGFRHFAYCAYRRGYHPGIDLRGEFFATIVEEAGFHCDHFAAFEPHGRKSNRTGWERQQEAISNWILGLPKPVAIMACNDDRGLEILEACRTAGLRVPDAVAVIGVDNDECIGRLSIPPLSSVDSSPEVVGYEAARLLDDLMNRKRISRRPRYIQPRGVVPRQSTDVLAIEEQEIVAALRYIRENACNAIRVTDVLEHARCSRATLESGFRRVVGRTIHQEIQRVRLERARELIATTSLPIKRIARDTGFQTVQYLTRVFRTVLGQPPARYRRQLQPDPGEKLTPRAP